MSRPVNKDHRRQQQLHPGRHLTDCNLHQRYAHAAKAAAETTLKAWEMAARSSAACAIRLLPTHLNTDSPIKTTTLAKPSPVRSTWRMVILSSHVNKCAKMTVKIGILAFKIEA